MSRASLQPDTQQVYDFIRTYLHNHRGLPPTQREIAEGCFIARSGVQRHLDILDARGLIVRELGMARGISLVEGAEDEVASQSDRQPDHP